jgi:hypothetical protein
VTDEHPNGHVEEAKVAAREEAQAIGRRTVRSVLLAFLVFGAAVIAAVTVVSHINAQACADRKEGREGLHDLVIFVTGPEHVDGENERISALRELVLPGGKLGPIRC